MDLLEALADPNLFASSFDGRSWDAWRIALRALRGLPFVSDEDRVLFAECTGRSIWPTQAAKEAWFVVGRRGGKSRIAALIATYLACFGDFERYLSAGERAVVMILASDRRQARVIFDYIRGLLDVPLLRPLIEAERAESIDLTNGITIEVRAASHRTTRGFTIAVVIFDEIAFFRDETSSASPDVEVVNAVAPGLATIPGSLLLGISSPYAQRGVLFDRFKKHWGEDGSDVFVWRAPSLRMNPSLNAEMISRAHVEDASRAASEWDAQWRRDIESFIALEVVEGIVVPVRRELPPQPNTRYFAFSDPSGGARDSFTLCIAHREHELCVVDVLRERRPPFSPDAVVWEFTQLCRTYRVHTITSDKYGSAFAEERWRTHGMVFRAAPMSKSDLYGFLLGQLNSGRVALLDDPKLVTQLVSLERRTSRTTGRELIDHPPGGHDDLANALAGAVHMVLKKRSDEPLPANFDLFDHIVHGTHSKPRFWSEGFGPRPPIDD